MNSLLAVARITWTETIAQPVSLLLSLFAAEAAALTPVMQMHTFGDTARLARDGGLAFALVLGLPFVLLPCTVHFARDLRDGTAEAQFTTRLGRTGALLGRYFGVLAALATFLWCHVWTILLAQRTAEAYVQTVRTSAEIRDVNCALASILVPLLALLVAGIANHRSRRRIGPVYFTTFAVLMPVAAALLGLVARDGTWLGIAAWAPALDIRTAALAVPLGAWLAALAALALALTTRLAAGASAAIVAVVLVLGFLLPHAHGAVVRTLAALVPDASAFWRADVIAQGDALRAADILRALAAGVSYAAAALVLGIHSLRTREL